MKTKDKKTEKQHSVFSLTRWRRLYVSAIEAHPGDFAESEPSGNLSRIFVVLLLVHVFLIGSIVIYNVVSERPRLENALTAAPPAKPKATPVNPAPPKPVEVAKATPVAPAPSPAPAPPVQPRSYEVGSGDSIPSIAAKFGVDPTELLTLNHLDDGGEIYPGRKLTIPNSKPGKNPSAPAVPGKSGPVAALTVTPQAAARVAPAPAAVAAVNKPTPPTVANKPVDTVPKATLVKAPMPDDKIKDSPPQAEKKPEKPVAAVTPPAPSKTAESKQPEKPAAKAPVEKKAASTQTYTTGSSDTFYSVSRKFKVKVDDLMRLNGVSDPSKLRSGMKLKIPAKE